VAVWAKIRNVVSKRVWILGAGFSQPLGGPLLKDLFRLEPSNSCEATFPNDLFPNLSESMLALQTGFYWGRKEAGYWDDAEQFLGFIDDAYAGSDAIKRKKLNTLVGQARRPHWLERYELKIADLCPRTGPLLETLDKVARRAFAAQCESFFLNRHPTEEEVWSPFVKWVNSLSATTDAVITFNYDRVLEMLDPAGTSLQVLLPDQTEDGKRVPVYRLHGGVSWELQEGRILHSEDPLALLKSPQAQIAIAAPGRAKVQFVGAHFEKLWKRAEEHLSRATTVFFVGYGFPKSDSMALRRVLDALKLKGCSDPVRDFHIVLGPETTSVTQRVVALLQACTSGRCLRMVPPTEPMRGPVEGYFSLLRIKQHPLWTQDFLGDWQDRIKDIEIKP